MFFYKLATSWFLVISSPKNEQNTGCLGKKQV